VKISVYDDGRAASLKALANRTDGSDMPSSVRVNQHPKRLDAARGRRDRGESPMPWDNELLVHAREQRNPRRCRQAAEPELDTSQAVVLAMLRRRKVSVAEVMRRVRCDQKSARSAIDSLRRKAWWIERTGPSTFGLVPHATGH